MTALLALTSAVLIGGADFVGALVSRRAPAASVAFVGQTLGLLIGIPLALAWGWDALGTADVLYSLASGLFVGGGLAVFYAAMAGGVISLAAPTTAVIGALVPVVVGFARGERPGTLALVGIPLALVAVAIVSLAPSQSSDPASRTRPILLAVLAGACFGLFYVSLAEVSEAAGAWPIPIQRVASVSLLALVLILTRTSWSTLGGLTRPGLLIACLEVAATVLVLLALQRGPLTIASVLVSLYPVTTVLLAALYLHERLSRTQLAGVGLALGAVVLISVG